MKAQENQENQAGGALGEDGKELALGSLDSTGGLMKFGSRYIPILYKYLYILFRGKNYGGNNFGFQGFGFQMAMNPELMGFNPPLMNEFLLPM